MAPQWEVCATGRDQMARQEVREEFFRAMLALLCRITLLLELTHSPKAALIPSEADGPSDLTPPTRPHLLKVPQPLTLGTKLPTYELLGANDIQTIARGYLLFKKKTGI
jgi:hypothetical protein